MNLSKKSKCKVGSRLLSCAQGMSVRGNICSRPTATEEGALASFFQSVEVPTFSWKSELVVQGARAPTFHPFVS